MLAHSELEKVQLIQPCWLVWGKMKKNSETLPTVHQTLREITRCFFCFLLQGRRELRRPRRHLEALEFSTEELQPLKLVGDLFHNPPI